jgi:hypothetical protein
MGFVKEIKKNTVFSVLPIILMVLAREAVNLTTSSPSTGHYQPIK